MGRNWLILQLPWTLRCSKVTSSIAVLDDILQWIGEYESDYFMLWLFEPERTGETPIAREFAELKTTHHHLPVDNTYTGPEDDIRIFLSDKFFSEKFEKVIFSHPLIVFIVQIF